MLIDASIGCAPPCTGSASASQCGSPDATPVAADIVASGHVSEQAFLAGYGAAQAVPGPLFSFAAYLGGPEADVRARLAGDLIMGVAISRAITDDHDLDAEGQAALRQRLARVIQAAIEP